MWAVVADGEDEEHCGGDGVGDDGGGRWCDRDPPRSLFSRLLPLATLLDDDSLLLNAASSFPSALGSQQGNS